MKKRTVLLAIFFFFMLLLPMVSALKIECAKDGSFRIENAVKEQPAYAKDTSGAFVEVEGVWFATADGKKFNFFSDEGIFISKNQSKQKIQLGKATYTVTCPPFSFSCRVFNVSIDYCYAVNGTFHAKYTAYNFDIDNVNTLRFDKPFLLRYDLRLPGGKSITHSPEILSSGFAELNITMRKLSDSGKFILQSDISNVGSNVDYLEIRYEKCRQKKFNLYESRQCAMQPSCTIDKDCIGDETCAGGFCQKLVCGECQYAANNSCFAYGCCDNSACAQDASCEKNQCVPLLCAANEAVKEHQCVELVCADDEVAEDHQCRKLSCAADEAAQNHSCIKLACAEDEFIENHQCRKLKCGFFQLAMEHTCKGWWAGVGKMVRRQESYVKDDLR